MSAFLTELHVELIEDVDNEYRGKWRLTHPFVYQSDIAGRITVPAGFLTDFESCPRLPVVFLLFGEICHQAAVIHDYAYSSHCVSREVADRTLKEAMIVSGIPKWRAYGVWLGVRIGGGSHY